ncbi:wiskott-Aldrich syndrome protein family member 2-like [Gossypium australe]|uniref:Wiskott-Aldrich syndrome protein family member 2-like n=1 Tax=Gossypium australe TaxID=47621 RepID=A0A5B6WEP8_9ROSI|nr:wiskott-Aldrich syndrome protein family member 2-like [Gossypium australe]
MQRPKKKARSDGPPYGDCGRCHLGECWRRIEACLKCGSLEHRIRECPSRADQVQASTSGPTQP